MPYIAAKDRTRYNADIGLVVKSIKGREEVFPRLEALAEFCRELIGEVASPGGGSHVPATVKTANELSIEEVLGHKLGMYINEADGLLTLAGDMNYVLSSVIWAVLDKARYGERAYFEGLFSRLMTFDNGSQRDAVIAGVLRHVSMEFYRRQMAPYEDSKILENGDLWPKENMYRIVNTVIPAKGPHVELTGEALAKDEYRREFS